MNSMVIGLLAETSLHPGCEGSGGIVDLPVAREAITSYPVLMGSGLKGALRDVYEQKHEKAAVEMVFGKPDAVGGISVSDGRLLLLPVRSLTRSYLWVTCPYILERFIRDLHRAAYDTGITEAVELFSPAKGQAISFSGEDIHLEELSFTGVRQQEAIKSLVAAIGPLVYHQSVQKRLQDQIIVINDDEFAHYAKFGLPVNARNVLDQKNKTSQNLWYEEVIPADSIFYTIIICRGGQEEQLPELKQFFGELSYVQVGGNETIGQGWCAISCWEGR